MPRTTKGGEGAKLQAIGFRTTPEIRLRLDEAAKASGRSLSQEVELRLVRSLDGDVLNALRSWSWGTPETELAIRLLSMAVVAIEGAAGQKWHKSQEVKRAVEVAFLRILNNIDASYGDGAKGRPEADAPGDGLDRANKESIETDIGSAGFTIADLVSATAGLGPLAKGEPSKDGGPVVSALVKALASTKDGNAT